MNKKRFTMKGSTILEDGEEMTAWDCCDLLNEQDKEIDLLRLELETHKHPLWSTREAERKVNKLADSLADEVKKNGLLNEEINQLKIENMRLKKKGGDGDMTNKRFIFVDNIFKYLETGIKDNKSDYDSLNGESVVDLLNEQQSTINNQEQKIKILQQEIKDTQAILEMLTEKLKGWNNE